MYVCEARIDFWNELIRMRVGTRELENIGESLHSKFKSKNMINNDEERELVERGAELKLKDEKKYRREIKEALDKEKKELGEMLGMGWKYRKKIKNIKREALENKKKEKQRLNQKLEHLRKLRKDIEEDRHV